MRIPQRSRRCGFILLRYFLLLIGTCPGSSGTLLYATNAVAIDECTLHTIDPSTGQASAPIGSVRDRRDGAATMGVFGMCHGGSGMFAVNHLDQLVTVDLATARATVVGAVGVSGLFDLACSPHASEGGVLYLYSYSASESRIVRIDPKTGSGQLLEAEIGPVDAVSMDFDQAGTLFLVTNGMDINVVDTVTGALTQRGSLPGKVHVNQRHGSIQGNTMYSAFFEADPSNIWQVDLRNCSVQDVVTTNLDSTYTLAFVNYSPLESKPDCR